jgi:cell division protein FtsZ
MAVGVASGEERARKAAQMAITNELLDVTINGASGILFNVTGGPDMSLFEVNSAAEIIRETADPNANLIFGAVIDENMGENMRVTVIATGFGQIRTNRPRFAPAEQRPTVPPQQLQRPFMEDEPASASTSSYDETNLEVPAFLRRKNRDGQ